MAQPGHSQENNSILTFGPLADGRSAAGDEPGRRPVPRQRKKRPAITPIGPSIAYIPLTRGQHALVDADDCNALSKFNWYAQWHQGKKGFYVARNITLETGKKSKIYMHRQLMGFPRDMEIDHVSGDALDNRRANLRAASHVENSRNRKRRVDNTSGFKGIYRYDARRWAARIRVGEKTIRLGFHDTPEAAHAAYCKAAEKHFGEFWRAA